MFFSPTSSGIVLVSDLPVWSEIQPEGLSLSVLMDSADFSLLI